MKCNIKKLNIYKVNDEKNCAMLAAGWGYYDDRITRYQWHSKQMLHSTASCSVFEKHEWFRSSSKHSLKLYPVFNKWSPRNLRFILLDPTKYGRRGAHGSVSELTSCITHASAREFKISWPLNIRANERARERLVAVVRHHIYVRASRKQRPPVCFASNHNGFRTFRTLGFRTCGLPRRLPPTVFDLPAAPLLRDSTFLGWFFFRRS